MPCLQTARDGRRRCASHPPSGTLHIQRVRFYQLPFRDGHSHLKADPTSSSSQSTWIPARLSERIWLMEWSPTCLGIHLKLGRISILWVCVCVCSYVRLFVTSGVANPPGSSLSMEFSRQEYWNELPFPTPGNLPNPGIEPTSPASPALAGRFFSPSLGGLCQSHCHVEKGVVSCWPSL